MSTEWYDKVEGEQYAGEWVVHARVSRSSMPLLECQGSTFRGAGVSFEVALLAARTAAYEYRQNVLARR